MTSEEKNSFILHFDIEEKLEGLSDEETGKVFKMMLNYAKNGELPDEKTTDRVLLMVFRGIKPQLDVDSAKWLKTKEKRQLAGQKGGLSKGKQNLAMLSNAKQSLANEAKLSNAKQNKQSLANQAVTVTVTDNVTVLKEKDTNVSQKKSAAAPVRYDDDPEVDKTIHDFIAHRKNIKKPMTDRAITLLINRLNDLSHGDSALKVEMLNTAILNGWQSVYEPNEQRSGRASPNKETPEELMAKYGTTDPDMIEFIRRHEHDTE